MRAALRSFGQRLSGQSLGDVALFARCGLWRPWLFVLPHLAALAVMIATETSATAMAAFLLA